MNTYASSVQDIQLQDEGRLLMPAAGAKLELKPAITAQTSYRAARLSLLQAVMVQVFVLSLLFACASFARAGGDSFVTGALPYGQIVEDRVQLASLIEDEKRPWTTAQRKHVKSSWALAFDNDLLAPGHRDRDYTYGMNITFAGADASAAAISLKTPLALIDRSLGIENMAATSQHNYSLEGGLFGFTPQDIEQVQLDRSDRPYASLVYFSSSHEQIDQRHNSAWKTSLVVGVLGLSLVGNLQNSVHQGISGKEARGWHHQISDGGELTARYVIARQHYLPSFSDSLEVKSTVQASLGYLTEASWSLSLRDGKIVSPWASFNPDLISYGEKSTYSNSLHSSSEHYFWAGITVKARLYNAFLQGQVRDSELTYNYDDLRPIIVEGWGGYTYAFKEGYRVSYVLRAQSSEIRQGDGDRGLVWGGLILAKII